MFGRPKYSSSPRRALIPGAPAPVVTRHPVMPNTAPIALGDVTNAEETIRQLEKLVTDFTIRYPGHTQRIPTMRPGEHPLIAFVRSMAASMAEKQDQLEKLNQEVITAAKEKERFFANVSHEVRTPMNGIFGMVNLLLEMDPDPRFREHLETIHSASESLLNILNDILDFAKLNAKQMQLKPRQFDLQKLIREVLLVYKPNADTKGIGLSAMICETLPEAVVADELRLKQVLANLTSNAIKFTDAGEVTVTVQKYQGEGREQLLFHVRDTGIGIDSEAGCTLFQPFHQIDSDQTGNQTGGTGLGLAISRSIVELMGGQIWFDSPLGGGTTFYFTVDYARAEPESDDFVRRSALPKSTMKSQAESRTRVLLVEDNEMNQKVARMTLEKFHCDVTVASNGREAVDLAGGAEKFDVILMDVNMPVMNGLEASYTIRRLDHSNAAIPIIAMTGMVFDEDKEQCHAAGMNDVITKPFSPEIIKNMLQSLSDPDGFSGDPVGLVS